MAPMEYLKTRLEIIAENFPLWGAKRFHRGSVY